MSKAIFGYWRSMRGFGQQTRLILRYLGVEHEEKHYDKGPAPEYSMEHWTADKFNLGFDFPNIPYWIDGSVKVTESKAVIRYIAKTQGNGVLYPQTPELQAVADTVEGVVSDLQRALVNVAYSKVGISQLSEEDQADKFKQLNDFLSKRQWTVGDKLSFVDFFVYEVLKQYSKFNKDILTPYPMLITYIEKFEALPQLTEYIKSVDHLPCYSPRAMQF